MRISDWSSDVCSSDLIDLHRFERFPSLPPSMGVDGIRDQLVHIGFLSWAFARPLTIGGGRLEGGHPRQFMVRLLHTRDRHPFARALADAIDAGEYPFGRMGVGTHIKALGERNTRAFEAAGACAQDNAARENGVKG